VSRSGAAASAAAPRNGISRPSRSRLGWTLNEPRSTPTHTALAHLPVVLRASSVTRGSFTPHPPVTGPRRARGRLPVANVPPRSREDRCPTAGSRGSALYLYEAEIDECWLVQLKRQWRERRTERRGSMGQSSTIICLGDTALEAGKPERRQPTIIGAGPQGWGGSQIPSPQRRTDAISPRGGRGPPARGVPNGQGGGMAQ
jgi:hypothetical protein